MPFVRRHAPALLTALALSAWFMLVYGVSNHLAASRTHVPSWRYEWERHIPFVPIFIIPYMSIDLLFFAAPFLCDTARERRTLAARIVLAVAVAGACFALMPFTLAIERPTVDGWLGPVFRFLYGFDQPYNLLPSLHIALRTIVADTFARHTRGPAHVASAVWFSLIGFSTVLVYQHHIVDVIGGFILAAVCFYAFREAVPRDRGVAPNRRVGAMYVAASCACAVLAFAWPWWSLWLLWPALSLALAAASSLRLGPSIYRKTDGRLPLSTRLVLGPLLLGQWLSLRHYARRSRPHDELGERLIIGRRLSDGEAAALVRDAGIVAVVDLTGEFAASRPFLALPYCNVQVADLTAPSDAQLDRAVAFIDEHAPRGRVYVHCKAGYSRTAAVAGAALLSEDAGRSVEEVLALLRAARAGIVIRPEIAACLSRYARLRASQRREK